MNSRHAANRIAKATVFAYIAWGFDVKASDVESMNDEQWAQLTNAARLSAGKDFESPSGDTRRLICAKLRDLEQRGAVAA